MSKKRYFQIPIVASIYLLSLSVCLYPIIVETTELVGPRFLWDLAWPGPGKVHGWSNFQKFASNKIRFLIIFKIHDFFMKSANFIVCFVLQYTQREHVYYWNRRWARRALKAIIQRKFTWPFIFKCTCSDIHP